MFSAIFSFEVNRWYRSVSTYIYFAILLAIAYLTGISSAGAFDGVVVSIGGEKVFSNSPVVIDQFITGINAYVGIIIIVAIIGNTILKDFTSNTHSLIFTTQVSRFNYLFGRFSASMFVSLFILTAPAWGLMIAYEMPFLDASRIGPFMFSAYWQNYLHTIIPNTLFIGSVFFAVSLIARDVFVIWLSLIVFFVALGVSNSYLSTLEYEKIAALLDPFGFNAKSMLTKYWSIYEKNHELIKLKGVFLYNRLIWISASLGIMAIGYSFFSFTVNPRRIFFKKKKVVEKETAVFEKTNLRQAIPNVAFSFTNATYFRSLWALASDECRSILRNTYFRIIFLFAIVFLLLVSTQVGKLYDTTTFPVTYQVLDFMGGAFQVFTLILTIMFSGELVWRARDKRMSNILDALPVPNWVYYTSKLAGVWFMQAILLFVIVISGIILQTYRGYTNFELLLYFKTLYGLRLINLWLLAVLFVMIQTMVSNRYIGFFICAIFAIWNIFFAPSVLEHRMLIYGSSPGTTYSDMNGFGHALYPFFMYKLYWAALAACFAILSALLWARGAETGLKERWAQAKMKAARPAWMVMLLSIIVFTASGSFIYYNTYVLNKFQTNFDEEEQQAMYEKKYKKFENLPQPKITSVKVAVDIYPYTRSLHAACTYTIKNKTTQPVDSIHLIMPDDVKLSLVSFGIPAKEVFYDKVVEYRIYKLSQPMQPGDSMLLSFDTDMKPRGFEDEFSGLSTPIYNGTFLNNTSFLPNIGYTKDGEMSDNNRRKKHGLAYRKTSNDINDTLALKNNVFFKDADFIDFETVVSTVPDQIAIAPGYLQREWTDKGRRYFHYKMDNKILNFYSFLSARYTVKKAKWNNVDLEVYYQKGHEYNIDKMLNGIQKSLDYYTTQFTPYQHKQVRILEFPRYQTFAQSFPNTIPFSEGIGFIADVSDTSGGKIDYPLQVTAHEVAHQWWAHQVIGGDVEGSNMLSESLAQYSSIMVVEKQYGEKAIQKFLRYELNDYLSRRSYESEKEKPLLTVDAGQQYILYQKGGYVLHALGKYIGTDSLNHALQRFLQQYGLHSTPYPTTLNLLAEVRKSTPDSFQYFVTDIFEKIVLYNNKIEAATLKKQNGVYAVDFTINAKKLDTDTAGREHEVACRDYVEVGAYNAKGDELKIQRYKLPTGNTKLTMVLDKEPAKLVIDPRHLLIEKTPEDNEKKLDKAI